MTPRVRREEPQRALQGEETQGTADRKPAGGSGEEEEEEGRPVRLLFVVKD